MTGAYARLYHKFAGEYPQIYADDHCFATWIRLLMLADATWPMRPPMPRSVRPRVLDLLTEVGLVIIDGDSYTIRGLDPERSRRQSAGRKGAVTRWDSEGSADRNAIADANAMPSKAKQSKAKHSIPLPPAERGRRKDATNPRAVGTSPRQNGHAPRDQGTSRRQQKRTYPVLAANVLAEMAKGLKPDD
jgi:hypothetical protein